MHKRVIINWELSLKCNLDCSFCSQQERRYDQKKELSEDDIYKIINNLPENSHVSFLWWETLLFKNIRNIFIALGERNITFEITTNGSLLKAFYKDLINYKHLTQINISIDGYGKVHDDSRGEKWLFDKIIEVIPLLQKSKDIHVSTVIIDMPDKDLVKIYKTLDSLWVTDHKLIYCMWFDDRDILESQKKIPELEIAKAGEISQEKIDRRAYFLQKFALLRKIQNKTRVSFEPTGIFGWEIYCKQISRQYRINELGELSICEFIKNSYTNIKDSSFQEALNDTAYRSMISLIENKFPLDICTYCCKNSKK